MPQWSFWTLSLLIASAALARAAEPEIVPLWEGVAPGSEGQTGEETVRLTERGERIISNVHRPSVMVYLPAGASAPTLAVLVIPGGGHREIWSDHEGHAVARWLSERGVAAFVLKYRLAGQPGSTYTVAQHEVADAKRAIRLIRSRATAWSIDPARIGAIGFSAGGEIAARLALSPDDGDASAADPVEREGTRLAFQALMYPGGTSLIQPTKDSPPAFICWGFRDNIPAIRDGLGSVYSRFQAAGVPLEMHVYSEAGHGFGIRPDTPAPVNTWIDRFHDWLGARGLLDPQGVQ